MQCAQSQGYHSIDLLKERGVERGSARLSSLKRKDERESWSCNQTNTGTVLKATFGTCLRNGLERIIMGFSERINAILK